MTFGLVLAIIGIVGVAVFRLAGQSTAMSFMLEGIAVALGIVLICTALIARVSQKHRQNSDELFRNLFEASPFPAAITNIATGNIVAVNQRVLARFGITAAQAIGTPVRNYYVNPEERDKLTATVRDTGKVSDAIVRLKSPGGDAFWAAVSARLVKYRGEPAMLTVFYDVDARIKAEEVLRASEQRLAVQSATLTELTATGASATTDLKQRLRHVLESCARTLGVARVSMWQFDDRRAAIECVNLFDAKAGVHQSGTVIPREGHAAYFEALERDRLIAAADAHTDPRTSQFSEGYLTPVGIGAMLDVPLRRDDRTVGVLCLEHIGGARQWTADEQNFALSVANLIAAGTVEEDRRQAVQRLAESEARAHLVIDTATDAFIGMDSGGAITAWNVQSERTFGWSRDEVVGRQLVDVIIPPDFRDGHIMGLKRFNETGEAPVVGKRLELSAVHRSGREFPIELSITQPIRSGEGHFFGAFLRDISERRQREVELRQAKDTAEAAARVKSEFLANMSHELRTPLNGVLGYAQLLRRDRSLAPSQFEAIDSIITCGEHLLNLINDVLDLSKIEAGRIDIEIMPTDLSQLVSDMKLLVLEAARKKGLELDCDVDPDLPRRVLIDGRHVRQVLLNLLGNAVKFTEHGSVRLSIVRENTSQVRFEVIDTGIGIEPEDTEVIFESFRQTHTGVVAGGSGLGLAISRKLVRAMGGELCVESELRRGSRFWFDLTLVADEKSAESELTESAIDHDNDLRLAPGQEVTVLVVDDSTINRRIMSSLLDVAGFRTLRATDGAEAIRIAHEQQPDLILMDLRMNGVDGFEATKRLRSSASTAAIPIIAVTASPGVNNRERALEAGCNAFLPKPLRARELYRELSQLLNVRFEPIAAPSSDCAKSPPPVPAAWASRIHRAAQTGNLSELHHIARQLGEHDEPLACAGRYIGELVNAFDFETLERWASEGHDAPAVN